MPEMWIVRAGRGAQLISGFLDNDLVAIGWDRVGDLGKLADVESVVAKVAELWPEYSRPKARMTASNLYRFSCVTSELS